MKAILFVAIIGLLGPAVASAADQTWKGQISDSMCGAHHMTDKHGKTISDRKCTKACVDKHAEYMLVSDGKVYKLRNHDGDLAQLAGEAVTLTGELDGETIKVLKVEPSK